jgi:hypothetical protein
LNYIKNIGTAIKGDLMNKKLLEKEIKSVEKKINKLKIIFGRLEKHKKDGMVDVSTKKCKEPLCIKQPKFNFKDKKTGVYCSEHKKDGMFDVKNKIPL